MGVAVRTIIQNGLIIAVTVFALDQLSKWLVLHHVMQPPRVIEVTPFFNLVLGWNTGISFGLFADSYTMATWLLPALTAVIILGLGVWLACTDRMMVGIGLGLIIGGATGNLVDRLRLGAVIDFLDFHAFGYHWPAFNVADTAITTGAILLIAESLLRDRERRTKKCREQAKNQLGT